MGTNLDGMTKEQAKWYLVQYKMVEKLRSTFLREGKVTEPFAYQSLKMGINKACTKLGVTLQPIIRQESRGFASTAEFETLRFELNEYRRRLSQIPEAVSAAAIVAA
jgi:hypothetical protein